MKNLLVCLQQFGLSDLESRSYEMALGLGVFSASILASRLDVPRSTARYTCESLVQKGFMIKTKKANTKLFMAENPTKLFALLHAEEERLEKKKDKLLCTIKELQHIYKPYAKTPKVTFYEGIDEVTRMLDDLLSPVATNPLAETLYAFGAGDYISLREPEIVKKFRSKSLKKYKRSMIIRAPKYKHLYYGEQTPKQYFRYIDEWKVDIQITRDAIAIISLEETSPIGLIIQHQDIADAFQQIFMEVWRGGGEEA